MKISIKLLILVRAYNVDTIFMNSNTTTTSCTKHVDIRYKYVNEYFEDGVVKIVFVKSAENDSDILTKYLSADPHQKHLNKKVGEKLKDVPSFKNILSQKERC